MIKIMLIVDTMLKIDKALLECQICCCDRELHRVSMADKTCRLLCMLN